MAENASRGTDEMSARLQGERRSSGFDYLVYASVVALGVMQYCLCVRVDDFVNDTTYFELARSLVERSAIPASIRTLYPPGFPLIVASVGAVFGWSPRALIRIEPFFFTLGVIAAYELLRRPYGRGLAAAACLLFGTSPWVFGNATWGLAPDIPYFFAASASLLIAARLDEGGPSGPRSVRWVLLPFGVALSILIRTVGIAFVFAIGVWLIASWLRDGQVARRRLALYLPALATGVAVAATWLLWSHRHEVLEWSIAGWPRSYLSQLALKDGHRPLLGLATLGEILRRIGSNAAGYAAAFSELLLHKFFNAGVYSPALTFFALAAVGLFGRIVRTGGTLVEWYFLTFLGMQLVWPWKDYERFAMSLAPLYFAYCFLGARTVARLVHAYTMQAALVGLDLSLILASAAFEAGESKYLYVWALMAALSASLAVRAPRVREATLDLLASAARPRWMVAGRSLSVVHVVAAVIVGVLLGHGVQAQLSIGRENLHYDGARNPHAADVEAARWLASHGERSEVVMAREPDLAYHYSGRPVVWFPPISDPEVLAAGIRKHHVSWIVVTRKNPSYWYPTEVDGVVALLRRYPDAVRLVYGGDGYWIYTVVNI
jgi:Dolichyl-phosphate-mannose-protein mannosyltransferase